MSLSLSLDLSLPSCSHAGGWGLTSALLATLTLVQFIYLFVVKERRRNVPNPWVLFVFGVIGSLGIGAGVGGFAAYLGLGVLDTINHRGKWECYLKKIV